MSDSATNLCSLFERRAQAAAVAMVTQPTIRAAAKECGVSAATLVRWSKLPPFLRLMDDTRAEQRRVMLEEAERRKQLQPA